MHNGQVRDRLRVGPPNSAAVTTVTAALLVSVLFAGCAAGAEHEHGSPATISAREPARGTPGLALKDEANLPTSSSISVRRYFYPVAHADRRQNWMDLYLPGAAGDDATPVVVLIHGGSWQNHVGADSFVTFARRLAQRGLAVFNVEYRRVGSGGGWPTTFTDVAAALDSIPSIADNLHQLDIKHAVVVGHSAGAQLAVWAGTRHRLSGDRLGANPRFTPTHIISLAGPLDMRRAVELGDTRIVRVLGGPPAEFPERYAEVDPIQNLDPSIGVIAVNGTADTLVPYVLATDYVTADNAAGGRARAVILPRQTHSSLVDPKSRAFTQIIELITRTANDAHNDAG